MYPQFQNIIVETPHEIALDYACKSILIKMCGSWSLKDYFIDAIPNPTSLKKLHHLNTFRTL